MANSAKVATPTAQAPIPTQAKPNLVGGGRGLPEALLPVAPWMTDEMTPTMPGLELVEGGVVPVAVPVAPALKASVTPAGPVGTGWPTYCGTIRVSF